ncbi:hypothetical protein CWI54_27565, partial [Escherichia coli]
MAAHTARTRNLANIGASSQLGLAASRETDRAQRSVHLSAAPWPNMGTSGHLLDERIDVVARDAFSILPARLVVAIPAAMLLGLNLGAATP